MKEIDLHGLTHSQALSYAENEILLGLQYPGSKVKVITGNSPTLQKKIQQQIVDKHNLSSYIMTNNLGTLIVTGTKI